MSQFADTLLRPILLALAAFFILATVLPLSRSNAWWVRGFDYPRPLIAIAGLLILGLYVWFWDATSLVQRLLLAGLVLSALYQGWRMFPYTPLAPVQVLAAQEPWPDSSISLLMANVLMTNRSSDRLIEIIDGADPDVIITVETDKRWQQELASLEGAYPFTHGIALDNTYGMLLYSRLELVKPQLRYLVDEEIPSIRTGVRLRDGQVIQLYALHPEPPSPTEALDTRERDAELLVVAREIAETDHPTIVAGDLNDVAWSSTTSLMQRMSGLLDPRVGRGLYSTFHAKIPFLRWPLDHVFHSDTFRLVHLERLPRFDSDHFPVFVRLSLEPLGAPEQEQPKPREGDDERVEEAIEEAVEKKEEEGGGGEIVTPPTEEVDPMEGVEEPQSPRPPR